VERLEESAKPIAPDRALGRITRADGMNDQAVSSAALERNRARLYQLESTLDRIDRPGFGDCVACGRPIPVERLLALPESTRCVRCASR
jgi:DnaK suppressor protein